MTTARVYQNAREPSRAVEQLQSLSGTVYDPKLSEAFVRLVGIYPIGSLVRLNSGELALVVRANPADPSRPFVRLLFDRSGRRRAEEQDVDLTELDAGTGRFRRTIIMAIDPTSKNFDVAKYLAAKSEAEAAASGGG
jgi:pyruvate/2-oxoglutarate dehydrogenase complex dihydrolipoamide acyltransferase (E2) component